MPIEYIFNGYYRSGTTIIWKILKSNNPAYAVFYEPLHPYLIDKMDKFKHKEDIDKLHGEKLWNEYYMQGNSFIGALSQAHTFRKNVLPFNTKNLLNYLEIFDKIPTKSILQTNRMHFHLKDVMDNYPKIQIYHIIRNPLDVYNSLITIYNNNKKPLIRFLSFLKNRHTPKSNIFFSKKHILFAFKKHGVPSYWGQANIRNKILKDPFKTHLLSWIISNYYALFNQSDDRFKLFTYEQLVSAPPSVTAFIENKTNLLFDTQVIRRKGCDQAIYMAPRILEAVNNLKLETEYHFIINKINKASLAP